MVPRLLTAPLRGLPGFIIIGAQKAGTSSLHAYLERHPQVGLSHKKEIQYFSYHHRRPLRWYRAHFPLRAELGEQGITGEASPYYLFHPHAARRVAEALPGVKLIALLREPVGRAYSNYNHHVRLGWESASFEDAVEMESERMRGERERMLADPGYYSHNYRIFSYLARGLYLPQILAWREHFADEQLLVLRAEDLFAEPERIYLQVLEFLELEPWSPGDFKPQNAGSYEGLSVDTRRRLETFYRPHNRRLARYLGWECSWHSSTPDGG